MVLLQVWVESSVLVFSKERIQLRGSDSEAARSFIDRNRSTLSGRESWKPHTWHCTVFCFPVLKDSWWGEVSQVSSLLWLTGPPFSRVQVLASHFPMILLKRPQGRGANHNVNGKVNSRAHPRTPGCSFLWACPSFGDIHTSWLSGCWWRKPWQVLRWASDQRCGLPRKPAPSHPPRSFPAHV